MGDETYTGDDGLLHCANCKGALERRVKEPILGKMIWPTTCKCRTELYKKIHEEAEAHQKQILIDAYRTACFHEKRMAEWTFRNDDGSVPEMIFAWEYVAEWILMKRDGIGLLLWGSVGSGKTYMAAAIANALLEQGVRVLMTDFTSISNLSAFDALEYTNALNNYDLLIIDDYGVERDTEFSLQNVYMVINRRWESGKPMIVTTNMELNEMKAYSFENFNRTRINDRILEMCKPIEIHGPSKREKSAKAKMNTLKEVFKDKVEDSWKNMRGGSS